jgi:hypothetical protein
MLTTAKAADKQTTETHTTKETGSVKWDNH